jgi:hypothetical protein
LSRARASRERSVDFAHLRQTSAFVRSFVSFRTIFLEICSPDDSFLSFADSLSARFSDDADDLPQVPNRQAQPSCHIRIFNSSASSWHANIVFR